jgi:hypothetical protein
MSSMENLRRDVQQSCAQVVALVDTDGERTLAEIEKDLWSALLKLARCAVALFLARRAAAPWSLEYEHDGVEYLFDRERQARSEIGTRFGKVPFVRPVGRRADRQPGPRDLPIDRQLGLVGGFSLGTVAVVGRLCAQMAFASARSTFRSFCEWSPSQRAVLRMVDAVGAQARGFLEAAPPPPDDGDILVIQVDGRGAPMIDAVECERRRQPRQVQDGMVRHRRRRRRRARLRPRRKSGEKSKNAKVAFVGVIYTLRTTDDGCEGPIGKRLYATFESHAALFTWLEFEAKKRGYGTKRTRMLFLADGAEVIWELQAQHFPDAEPCLDWYHVVEKLWEVGRCLHAEGSPELTAWVAARTRDLRRRNGAKLVLDALSSAYQAVPKTGPGSKAKREKLDQVSQHLTKHQRRINYYQLRRNDLDIGSGAVEGAVRNLVGMRLDGPGMRWSRDRSEHILHLRCILLNGQWDDFVAHLAERPLHLAATPTPTRTHDAARKVA